jgi:hypothetical protein
MLNKTLITVALLLATVVPMSLQVPQAQAQFTVLPNANKSEAACKSDLDAYAVMVDETRLNTMKNQALRDSLLGCAVQTGRISLNMIPYFITYVSNFLLGLVGLISMLFIVVGGYFYIWGGLTENKEKGKKTVYHALLGMAVALLAWTFINVIISAVTS